VHTRYGFELFSESTSDKVIHAADCDVLAVRVP
ncbi:MAG TPA: universal stress protein UspA, partial [Coxiellaceae bacterium]|nr:universal stress protein UspA [Coxiellaceae bacterium]